MSLKEKERSKESQDKFQAILSGLLKDEDNKYCVDCDAKGPRWASWNLGIFMCIRCAGIHRNLGVHISKVKSVNLDTWTAEQVAMMQEMGNSRGRAVYEANLPDGFRRPQTDSALESFIRNKYEHKKYIAREFVAPKPTVPKEWFEDNRGEKKRVRAKATGNVQIPTIPKTNSKLDQPTAVSKQLPAVKTDDKIVTQKVAKPVNSSNDLLGLDLGSPQLSLVQQAATPAPANSGSSELLDLFGGFQSVSPAQSTSQAALNNQDSKGTPETDLFSSDSQAATVEEDKKSAKDSIMALFGGGSGAAQPQAFGVPGGMYMSQAQAFNQQGIAQQSMMTQQPQSQVFNQQQMPQQGMMVQQPQAQAFNQQVIMSHPQGQGMIGNPQNLMGNQGMIGNQQNIIGSTQSVQAQQTGIPQSSQMNGSQVNMFGNQQTAMYNPQHMQQLQFQQMQQQMTTMNMGAPQMGGIPQQTVPGSGWGNQASGQTLSNNLWQ